MNTQENKITISFNEKNESCYKTICINNIKEKKSNPKNLTSREMSINNIYEGSQTENNNCTSSKNFKLNTIEDFHSNSEMAGNQNSNFLFKYKDIYKDNFYENEENLKFTDKINISTVGDLDNKTLNNIEVSSIEKKDKKSQVYTDVYNNNFYGDIHMNIDDDNINGKNQSISKNDNNINSIKLNDIKTIKEDTNAIKRNCKKKKSDIYYEEKISKFKIVTKNELKELYSKNNNNCTKSYTSKNNIPYISKECFNVDEMEIKMPIDTTYLPENLNKINSNKGKINEENQNNIYEANHSMQNNINMDTNENNIVTVENLNESILESQNLQTKEIYCNSNIENIYEEENYIENQENLPPPCLDENMVGTNYNANVNNVNEDEIMNNENEYQEQNAVLEPVQEEIPQNSTDKYVPILSKYKDQIPLEYIPDIWKTLKTEEIYSNKPCHHKIITQTDINFDMRAILIDWIVEVHKNYRLFPETLYVCISIIDRYLAKRKIERTKLQLLGTTALFLASKYEEIQYPCLIEFSKITDSAYDKNEILKFEVEIITVLKYNLTIPSPFRFFEIISLNYNFSEVEFYYGNFLIEYFLLSGSYTKYYPSIIALAVVLIILKLKKYESYKDLYNLTEQENHRVIKECAKEIYEFPQKCQYNQLFAVKNKYNSPMYHSVAVYQLENPSFDPNHLKED